MPARFGNEHGRRVLLVGQAPGSDGDARPLTGTMGLRLQELSGVGRSGPTVAWPSGTFMAYARDEWIGLLWDRANVLDRYPGRNGKGHAFPRDEARLEASRMDLTPYGRVLFCGRAVWEAFRTAHMAHGARSGFRQREMLDWFVPDWVIDPTVTAWAWIPHTSGVVTFWNAPENREAVRVFLEDLVEWTLA